MITYRSRFNNGVSLLSFGFGESADSSPEAEHTKVFFRSSSSHESMPGAEHSCTTNKPKDDVSCSQLVIPPMVLLRKSTAMYQAVMAACVRVGGRLPTFEYADVVLELECVDWRANDETVHRYIRYLLEDGKIKRYARGVYSL